MSPTPYLEDAPCQAVGHLLLPERSAGVCVWVSVFPLCSLNWQCYCNGLQGVVFRVKMVSSVKLCSFICRYVAGNRFVWSSALFHVATHSRGGGVVLCLVTAKKILTVSFLFLFLLRSSNWNYSLQDLWRQIIRHPLRCDNMWGL